MKRSCFKPAKVFAILLAAIVAACSVSAADKLPPERAGQIGSPTGKIAFIRDGNIWVIDSIGTPPRMVCEVSNAVGKLSWSPDNRRIAFTRSGTVDLKGPDFMGGRHKVYDLFICYLDSADAGSTMFWRRLTEDLGSRDPEWQADGSRILFWKDLHANIVNTAGPNYQIATIASDGTDFRTVRKNNKDTGDHYFLVNPSANKNGDMAVVFFGGVAPAGLAVLPVEKINTPLDSVKNVAAANREFIGPCWSPDGQWIAMVNKAMNDGGLYVATPDLKTKYTVASPPAGTNIVPMTPSFSPDSKWITFSTADGCVWICDITGNSLRRLTGPGKDTSPCWSR